MKVEICIGCAGKYLTGQYDPIGETNKRKEQGIVFDQNKCDFCGNADRTHLLGHRGSGGILIDLKTNRVLRKFY